MPRRCVHKALKRTRIVSLSSCGQALEHPVVRVALWGVVGGRQHIAQHSHRLAARLQLVLQPRGAALFSEVGQPLGGHIPVESLHDFPTSCFKRRLASRWRHVVDAYRAAILPLEA